MDEKIEVIVREQIEKVSKEITKYVKRRFRIEQDEKTASEEQWMESIESRNVEQGIYNKNILLVVATQMTEEEYRETDCYRAIEKLIYDQTFVVDGNITLRLDLKVVSENKLGLSEVYNKFITDDYEDYYVCFIHDDLIIQDTLFFDKLQEAHTRSEVVGVAGATNMMLPFSEKRATAWHELCKDEQGVIHGAGQVLHVKDGRHWSSHYGHTPATGKLIDGILMSFDVAKCLQYNFEFDERFKFHHYDITASLRALKCGFTIGIEPISVLHKSVGGMDESWKQSHFKFVNAYREYPNIDK